MILNLKMPFMISMESSSTKAPLDILAIIIASAEDLKTIAHGISAMMQQFQK